MLIESRSTSSNECPPVGIYNVVIKSFGELRFGPGLASQKTGNIETDVDQSMWVFEICDYDYDPDDEEDFNWNGETIDQYFTFYTTYRDSQKKTDTYLAENSNVFPFLEALMGRKPTREDKIDLPPFLNRKLQVRIAPKPSGNPKLSSPVLLRERKAKQPKPQVEVAEEVDGIDDDSTPFDENKAA